jgi:hypothetical protein
MPYIMYKDTYLPSQVPKRCFYAAHYRIQIAGTYGYKDELHERNSEDPPIGFDFVFIFLATQLNFWSRTYCSLLRNQTSMAAVSIRHWQNLV